MSPGRVTIAGMKLSACAALASLAGTCLAQTASAPAAASQPVLRAPLRECDVVKRGGAFGLMLALRDSAACDLVRKGPLTIDGRALPVYLPDGPYALENKGRSDFTSENEATCIAIDADADGQLADAENWYANLPVRIGDQMYAVQAIEPDGKWIDLAPSSGPLTGIVLDRKLPSFSYQTSSGKMVSQDDFRGRPFLLDIWSVT